MARFENRNWNLNGTSHDDVMCALLMDIRDRLDILVRRANCPELAVAVRAMSYLSAQQLGREKRRGRAQIKREMKGR